jgi:sugar phosphate isomerase/epimerase
MSGLKGCEKRALAVGREDETRCALPLGLNMHPKWVENARTEDFLFPLRELGLSVLEFTLNHAASEWPQMCCLIQECHRLGFTISFHAPYKGRYNPAGFSSEDMDRIKRLYEPAIRYAASVAQAAGPTTLVVHGAKGKSPREELWRDTTAFLAWLVKEFPALHPSIELLVKDEGGNKIGDNKAELVQLVSSPELPTVGICWDLGHDVRNGSLAAPPGFMTSVCHVHVHDISPIGQDHSPLVFGNVPYADDLRQLTQAGYHDAVILEVNGYLVSRFAKMQGIRPFEILRDNLSLLRQLAQPPLR